MKLIAFCYFLGVFLPRFSLGVPPKLEISVPAASSEKNVRQSPPSTVQKSTDAYQNTGSDTTNSNPGLQGSSDGSGQQVSTTGTSVVNATNASKVQTSGDSSNSTTNAPDSQTPSVDEPSDKPVYLYPKYPPSYPDRYHFHGFPSFYGDNYDDMHGQFHNYLAHYKREHPTNDYFGRPIVRRPLYDDYQRRDYEFGRRYGFPSDNYDDRDYRPYND